jgi:hypothetical protein
MSSASSQQGLARYLRLVYRCCKPRITAGILRRRAVPLKGAVEPTTHEAAMLAKALDEMLPEGAVVAKYRLAVHKPEQASELYNNMLRVKKDFEVVDTTSRECARMVAARCLQQAHVIEKV